MSSRAMAAGRDTAVLAGAAGFALALAWSTRDEPLLFASCVLAPLAFVATGLLLRRDPRRAPNAALCFWAAACTALGSATGSAVQLLATVGWAVEPASAVPLSILLLRYPGARLSGRAERALPWAAAAWSTTWSVAWLTGTAATLGWWPWLPAPLDRLTWWLITISFVAFAAALVALVIRRVLRSRGGRRTELVPVAVAAVALGAGASWQIVAFVNPAGDDWGAGMPVSVNLLMLLVPGIFLADAVLHVVARARMAELVVRMAGPQSGSDVQAALRRALADPGLEVRYWSPEDDGYLDAAGRPAALPSGDDRLLVPVEDRLGTPLAVVVTDRALQRRPDVVEAAVGAGRLALENARLHATVLAQLAAVRESRQRLVEAALAERRQVERDLHDGAQQRLLALTMTLGRARATADPVTRTVLDEGRDQLRTALQELRDLARGIHPAVLTQLGLRAAVESLLDGAPVRATVDVPAERWPAAVEATAYFVVAEGLANAVRHAGGTAVEVRVRHRGDELEVEVADDGPGPATADGHGTGLAGLADRVGALGGTVSLESGANGGGRLVGRIPCG